MSCEQHSSGVFFLGKAASVSMRVALAKKLIEHEQKIHDRAILLWSDKGFLKTIKDMVKKDGSNFAATSFIVDKFNPIVRDRFGFNVHSKNNLYLSDNAWDAVVLPLSRGLKPTKKEIEQTKTSQTEFDESELHVDFNHKDGTVIWTVHSNNHAHDHALESTLGKLFMALMSAHAWTPKTGGVVYYRDEYMDDYINTPARVVVKFGGRGERAVKI